jgi:hypothetical protein
MDDDRYSTGWRRAGKSKESLVADLLRKTIENGATPSEEVSAVQLAHMLVRQHNLDIDIFRANLSSIGDPPRYLLTSDGFLVPTKVIGGTASPAGGHASGQGQGHTYGSGHPRRRRDDHPQQSAADRCPISPTGRHRMERYMRGTRATGAMYCLHCGYRTE